MTSRTSNDTGSAVPALDLARLIARAADDKGGLAVQAFEVSAILSICDVFVVASAGNTRLVGAIANEIEEVVGVEYGIRPAAVEGLDARRWVLIDYGDVIVHVFLDEERTFYRLERLYSDAPRIDLDLRTRELPAS